MDAAPGIAATPGLEAVAQLRQGRTPGRRARAPARSAASPKPTTAGTLTVEARRRRSWAAADQHRRERRARHGSRAPPRRADPENLCAAERQVVDPQLLDVDRDLANRLHRVAEHRHAARPARAPTSATGWRVPTSLLASISASERACRGASAAAMRPGSTTPSPRAHTRGDPQPGAASAAAGAPRIEGCSSAETTIRSPGRRSAPAGSSDHRVVGLGSRGAEDDLDRRPATDQPRHAAPARPPPPHAPPGRSDGPTRGCPRPAPPEPGEHRLAHPGSRGVVALWSKYEPRIGRRLLSPGRHRIRQSARCGPAHVAPARSADSSRPPPCSSPPPCSPRWPSPAPSGRRPPPGRSPRRTSPRPTGLARGSRVDHHQGGAAPPSSSSTRTTSATLSSIASGRRATPFPTPSRNELRESWRARVDQARPDFGSLKEDRARFFLLNGAPAVRMVDQCGGSLWPLEIWLYPATRAGARSVDHARLLPPLQAGPVPALVSRRRPRRPDAVRADRSDRLGDSRGALEGCLQRDDSRRGDGDVLRRSRFDFSRLIEEILAPIAPISREWVATFNSYSTDLPADAAHLTAELSINYSGRRQSRSVLQGTLAVPTAGLEPASNAGARSFDFQLNGEILIGRKLFDAFRYKFGFRCRRPRRPRRRHRSHRSYSRHRRAGRGRGRHRPGRRELRQRDSTDDSARLRAFLRPAGTPSSSSSRT